MALRRLNILNFRSIVSYGRRWCHGDSTSQDVIIPAVEPESSVAEISSITLKKDENRLLKEIKNNDSFLFTPAVPQRSETLAAFVSKSELLQNFVKLGVNLSVIEKDSDMAEYFIKADFKTDIQPYILFLYDHKILPENMGTMFTKHPSIFKESLDNLQLRIDYFKSKDFSEESVARIVTKEPSVLTTSTLITDKQLGFLQKTFQLKGYEVREVVTKFPKLIVWKQDFIRDNKAHMEGTLGFQREEIKNILLQEPRLLVAGKYAVSQRFDYLHNTMGLSHEVIMEWPAILKTRTHIIRQRHQFLKFIGKDQFDKKSENYVSSKALVTGSDQEFCDLVAKVPVQTFNEYLKSL